MPTGKIRISSVTVTILLFLSAYTAKAQISVLKNKLETIAATHKATVGICISGPKQDDTLTVNGNRYFPMQSVFKFPIALAILHMVDGGKLSFDQKNIDPERRPPAEYLEPYP